MQRRRRQTVALVCGLVTAMACAAQSWEILYQTDFSTDPGWNTNQPENYYWEPATQTYFSRQIDGTNGYAEMPLPRLRPDRIWRVEYDIYVIRMDFAGNGAVCLTDPSRDRHSSGHEYIVLDFNNADYQIQLWWRDSTNYGSCTNLANCQPHNWYRAMFQWNPHTGTLYAEVRDRATGVLHDSKSVSGLAPFLTIDRLALTVVGDIYSGWIGEVRLDNVIVAQSQPGHAMRDLSYPRPFYCPGEPKTVAIDLAPPAGTLAIALEDAPPAGWTDIQNISNGGHYDPINHKVKWGPFFEPFPTFVSYDVVPPGGASGEQCFAGTISIDGVNEPIAGDECIDHSCCPFAPADDVHDPCPGCADCSCAECQDGRIELCEVIGYACAWKTGCNDDLAGMTRSAFLWRSGECYCWDEYAQQWMPHTCDPPPSGCCPGDMYLDQGVPVMAPGVVDTTVLEVQSLPGTWPLAGDRLAQTGIYTISVTVSPPPGTQASAVEIAIPAGWQVLAVQDGGAWDPIHAKAKWGVFFGDESIAVTLQVLPRPGPVSPSALAGVVSFDGANQHFVVPVR